MLAGSWRTLQSLPTTNITMLGIVLLFACTFNKCILCWICFGHYLKCLTEPYDSAIPLLGIYPEKIVIQKDTCTPMFSAALSIIARTWKQPTSINRWMDTEDVVYVHHNRTVPSHKKEQHWVICTDMGGPRVCHTAWNKSKGNTYSILMHIYGI